MKKISLLILALALVISLCACGKNNTTNPQPDEEHTAGLENETGTSTPGNDPGNDPTTDPGKETDPSSTDPSNSTQTNNPVHIHSYSAATCTQPEKCSCGATKGNASGHTWSDATCTTPKTCSKCSVTEGSAAGHTWSNATCTTPKTCTACEATEGSAAGHQWAEATCTAPKTCSACGIATGDMLPHNYQNTTCTVCQCPELGYGNWQASQLWGDYLYIITIHFGSNSGSGGISRHDYQDTESLDANTLDALMQSGADIISLNGKSYIDLSRAAGDPCYYAGSDNSVTVYIGEANSQEWFTLQRYGKYQLTVIEVSGCQYYHISAGAIFQ